MTDVKELKPGEGTVSVKLIEEMQEDQSPMSLEELKQLVLSMGDDDFLIQIRLVGGEESVCR